MKAIQGYSVVPPLVLMLWAGSAVHSGFGQQQSTPPVWRQFGSSDSAPSSDSAGWRHFGSARGAPNATVATQKSDSRPSSGGMISLERQMYDLINRDRVDPGNADETHGRAQPLRWNGALAAVARQHSREMLRQKFFAHVDREGRSPGTRVKAAGIGWQSVGENIAIYDKVPAAQAAFMNEPRFGHNHRSNILDAKYTDVGVGIVQAPDGRYYITQEFIEQPRNLRAAF